MHAPQVPATIRTEYRADIDGLCAVAVLSVLLFHLSALGFGGGFVGVDVFFVISGYLITKLMIKDGIEDGSFTLSGFYVRRARRLFARAVRDTGCGSCLAIA
jgi:peptidoglycan/LPS O-acetylase OafA/YrhL